MLAAVQVVELGLGHGIVHVDGREEQVALLGHDVESVHTSGGLLRHANHAGGKARHFLPFLGSSRLMMESTILNSGLSTDSGSGRVPSFS